MARKQSRLVALGAVGAGLALATLWAAQRPRVALDGRVVLIAGGSRGLGLELARVLAARGARLVIAARDMHELDRARQELTARGADVLAVPCDVTDRAQAEALVAQSIAHFGQVDVLINNAGRIEVGPMESMLLSDYEQAMATHFWAPLYLSRAVLPEMTRRGDGHIVNIASLGGLISVPHLLPYSASKFALVGLSEGLSAELASKGVVVTTVCPGLMRTGSPVNARFKGQHQKEYAWFATADALPGMSMNAARAATRIVRAIERRERRLVLGAQARFAALLHALAPELALRSLGLVNRMLPEPGGIGTASASGGESSSRDAPGLTEAINTRAARRNNELPPLRGPEVRG